ncbi:MAG: alpha/beta hydrolase [Myxococcota bacterium]
MSGARETTLVSNGLTHHVVTWGEKPVDVLLCHGFLDIAWSFDRVASSLADRGHGVASFDWRGHGESDWIGAGGYYHFPDYVLDLEGLIPQLADRPVHLVGHSMGGGACAMFAAARPDMIRTLTLVEGIGPPEMQPREPAKRLALWLDGVAKQRAGVPKPMKNVAEAIRRMRIKNPELDDELGGFLVEKSTTAVDGGLRWTFDPLHKTFAPRPFQRSLFQELLADITVPTLFVGGERGMRLPDEQEYVSAIPDHRVVEIEDVGHMIHWFEPERLASELAAFIADHTA